MTLAKRAIEVLTPALGEAALPFDRFQGNLEEMSAQPHEGEHLEYSFKPSMVIGAGEAFNHLQGRLRKMNNHMEKGGVFVRASVNSEGSLNCADGCLWDAKAKVENGLLVVTGWGGQNKSLGEAMVSYDDKGKLVDVIHDTLEGIIIEKGRGRILEMTAKVSPGLGGVLRSTFGPGLKKEEG